MHDDDGTGGLFLPLFQPFLKHSFPICLLNTVLHDELMVEVLVFIPQMPNTYNEDYRQHALKTPNV